MKIKTYMQTLKTLKETQPITAREYQKEIKKLMEDE